ncbi:MAG: hypothetical protein AVDCRST_MAG07-3042, partial [uncultured Frankineae bacterium]
DLPRRGRGSAVPRPRAEPARLGVDPAHAGAARPPDHRQEDAGPRRAAGRGLDLLRRHVRPRRAVARRAVPRGRPAPGAALRPVAAQGAARARAHRARL